MLFWVPSPVLTPSGNDSESLPLFSLFSATWDDGADSEEDFWTSLREDVVCIMLLFEAMAFFFRLNMFRRPHRGISKASLDPTMLTYCMQGCGGRALHVSLSTTPEFECDFFEFLSE